MTESLVGKSIHNQQLNTQWDRGDRWMLVNFQWIDGLESDVVEWFPMERPHLAAVVFVILSKKTFRTNNFLTVSFHEDISADSVPINSCCVFQRFDGQR